MIMSNCVYMYVQQPLGCVFRGMKREGDSKEISYIIRTGGLKHSMHKSVVDLDDRKGGR